MHQANTVLQQEAFRISLSIIYCYRSESVGEGPCWVFMIAARPS